MSAMHKWIRLEQGQNGIKRTMWFGSNYQGDASDQIGPILNKIRIIFMCIIYMRLWYSLIYSQISLFYLLIIFSL